MCDGLPNHVRTERGYIRCLLSIEETGTPPEVSSFLGCFQRFLRPKRDRAIVLLAAVLGMRAGGIKALRLSDIDWRSKTISFVQRKAQVVNALPMPEEVWLAVADYVKDERLGVGDDHVFMTANTPTTPWNRRMCSTGW